MTSPEALLDTNVVIAAVVASHVHHQASWDLLRSLPARHFAFAGHSHAEAFSQLTRRGPKAPFQLSADAACAAMEIITQRTVLVGLGAVETRDAVEAFAKAGGIGPRLYDWLIGRAAVQAKIGVIVTWNVGHMRSLFPDLDVVDPTQAIALNGL